MPQGPRKLTPTAPAHIATFGTSRLFGSHVALFSPEPQDEEKSDPYGGVSRQQFINEEKARQLDKGVDYLAAKNAELQADLNAARARLPRDGQVTVSQADAALLESYREHFPTPKDAVSARERLRALEEKEELRSYDDARREALAAFSDLPENFQRLIPTAEELTKRAGGKEQLKDLDLMRAQVESFATAYGAEKQDKAKETDVGESPASVKGGGSDKASTVTDAAQAAREYVAKLRAPQT